MFHCIICATDVVMDEVEMEVAEGRCICLRCWARETDTGKPLSRRLRLEATRAAEEGTPL